jgi:glycosyltransferase involved in cell wall biosynthesis
MPAYNAAVTLSQTVAELDRDVIDEIVLVDDASTDQTVSLARELGLEPILHDRNLGYGANQKTCYRRALDLGADIIVMVHPDYQYSPLLVPAMASMIAYGEYDMVLGSRILAQNSVARGMPRYKYVANRFLTGVENILLQQKLSEYHTGLRAFSAALLAGLPFERNSDDFVFDNQIIGGRQDRRGVLPDPLPGRGVVDQPAPQHHLRSGRAANERAIPAPQARASPVPLP